MGLSFDEKRILRLLARGGFLMKSYNMSDMGSNNFTYVIHGYGGVIGQWTESVISEMETKGLLVRKNQAVLLPDSPL